MGQPASFPTHISPTRRTLARQYLGHAVRLSTAVTLTLLKERVERLPILGPDRQAASH